VNLQLVEMSSQIQVSSRVPNTETVEGGGDSYERLATSDQEFVALRAAVSTLEAKMAALEAPEQSTTSANLDGLADNLDGPPLLRLCVGGGCIQETPATLSSSVYFISYCGWWRF